MAAWDRHEASAGSRYLTCPALAGGRIRHAFTLRPEKGAAPPPGGPEEEIREAIGLGEVPTMIPRQVHGCTIALADAARIGGVKVEADAVIVDRPGLAAAIGTADCIGAILHAGRTGAFAVIHAGWRGTLSGVLPHAIDALEAGGHGKRSEMTLAMGPAIGRCCYEVGEEVADAFRDSFPARAHSRLFDRGAGRVTLDLIEANRFRAEESGIPSARIHAAGICTRCAGDLCWSWRGQGAAAGRMWTFAGLAT